MKQVLVGNTSTLHKDHNVQIRVMHLEPGHELSRHYHSNCKDIIIGIQGLATLLTEDDTRVVRVGDVFVIDKKIIHQIINSHTELFVYLLIQLGPYDFKHADK